TTRPRPRDWKASQPRRPRHPRWRRAPRRREGPPRKGDWPRGATQVPVPFPGRRGRAGPEGTKDPSLHGRRAGMGGPPGTPGRPLEGGGRIGEGAILVEGGPRVLEIVHAVDPQEQAFVEEPGGRDRQRRGPGVTSEDADAGGQVAICDADGGA